MKISTFKRLAGLIPASALALGLVATTQEALAAPSTTSVIYSRHNLSSSRPTGPNTNDANGDQLLGDIHVTSAGLLDASGNLILDASGNATATDVGVDTTQVCVFCHTPHGANTAMAVPLWNKATPATTDYGRYVMKGRDSLGTPTDAPMSLACLSCHDGTQAMDSFMNAPGIHINPSDGTGTSAGYIWTTGSDPLGDTFNGRLRSGIGETAVTETGPIIGTSLTNDHPIGMQYCGKQTTPGTCDGENATQFTPPGSLDPAIKIFNPQGRGDTPAGRREVQSANTGNVECASCHNPHGTGNQAFLRVPRTGSAICLACHVK